MKKHYNIPIFIPHLGCPYNCIFCDQKRISGQIKPLLPSELNNYIKKQLSYIPTEAKNIEIAFFGGNFTGIDHALQSQYLQTAQKFIDGVRIIGLRVSTRPDAVNTEILQCLRNYRVHTIELGVQSLVNEVLQASARYYTVDEVAQACRQIKKAGFALGLQLMPGLPEDNWENIRLTTRRAVAIKPDFIRIYPTLVIADTALARDYAAGEYIPLSLEQAVAITKEMWLEFSAHDIAVIRLGLYAEDMTGNGSVIAGPYHPAFGELVRQSIFMEQVDWGIEGYDHIPLKPVLDIWCHPRDMSAVIGQHRGNINYWIEKWGFAQVKLHPDPNIVRGDVVLGTDKGMSPRYYLIFRPVFLQQRQPWQITTPARGRWRDT